MTEDHFRYFTKNFVIATVEVIRLAVLRQPWPSSGNSTDPARALLLDGHGPTQATDLALR